VDGQTFDSFQAAAQRSCDNQFQACQGVANGNGGGKGKRDSDGKGKGGGKKRNVKVVGVKRQDDGGLTVQQCDEQKGTPSLPYPFPSHIVLC